MIKTIFLFAYLGLYLVLNSVFLPFWLLFFLLGMRNARRKVMRLSAMTWARHFLFVVGAKVIVEGVQNVPESDRVCFISNHQSVFDILILLSRSGKTPGFIAKKELIYAPLLNFWMVMIHCIFIDRRNIRKSAKAIDRGVEALKKGNPMAIFPEGTRGPDGSVADFKPGSLKLATRSGAIIVPVTMVNTAALFERKGRFQSATVRVIFHEPVPTEGLSVEEKRALSDKVRACITAGLPGNTKEGICSTCS